jgi:regulator of protease activity HflC (stomatin/prohibitin superfamily)
MIAMTRSRGDKLPSKPTIKRRTFRFIWRHLAGLVLFLLTGAFILLVLAPYVVVNVPSGHVGLLWKRLGGGTVLDPRYLRNEGFSLIWPWDRLFLYDLRIQSTYGSYDAITSDGINLSTTLNIRFRLRREGVPLLHQTIGPNYLSVLGPEVASRMREVISQYTAEQVYSTQRENIQEAIKNRVVEKLADRFMVSNGERPYRMPIMSVLDVYNTLLHEIKLPAAVVAAINRKAEQFYIAQEFIYRVDRENLESQRKRIEAQGIRDFQQIVSQGITDSYLRLRGIEATLELAKSHNSKVVIVGSGRDGLPIILGNVDGPPTQSSGAGARPGATSTDTVTRPAESGTDPSAPSTAPPPAGPAHGGNLNRDNRSQLPLSTIENFVARLWNRPAAESAPDPKPVEAEGVRNHK